ncbi:WxL protein peptidoglycan domain-containing protein [Streptomyces sp. NBC_00829]|uniref:WxL protein peptidoglycan domain-containing protein n=1 Tax=Streptomyces sp. NBC_00829 TaxID=2903679 RepID=UPI00386D9DA9|nr:DUF916 domain-containing protein [Streptomyces sp. NBC_00829]
MSPTPAADTLRRIARVVLLALALALAPVPGSPTSPVAHAADNGTWSVYPTPSKATDPASRTYFTLTSPPGATLKDHVTISNQSDHPITFKVYGADAYNTPRDGGFALRGTDEPQTDIGAWIKLDTTTVTVPAPRQAQTQTG